MSVRKKSKNQARASKVAPNSSANAKDSNGHSGGKAIKAPSAGLLQIAPAILDFSAILGMVFGGCCSNVVAYERLLLMNPRIGSALTFSQMLFVTLQTCPSFIVFPPKSLLPRLKPRQVPLRQWALQVLVLTSGSLLNNWAYAYKVPLTVLIVFRSAGLPVSMLFGFLFLKRRYTLLQIMSVAVLTLGATISALSRSGPAATLSTPFQTAQDLKLYVTGISMLLVSLFCTACLGMLQERTYQKYGPCWREGLFYTHFLSLPAFLFLGPDIKQGFLSLSKTETPPSFALLPYAILMANLCSQYICVLGVNQLQSRVSSVSTNIALTARKALSLCLSVWWFGNEWNLELGLGAGMVFLGSLLYTTSSGTTRSGQPSKGKSKQR